MTAPGQDVALPSDYETGLEDFDASQASLPRINIMHKDGVFKDTLTGEEFPLVRGVALGLIKQRIMWEETQETDSKPMCKSNDGEYGYPNITGPQHSLFPWHASGIADPSQLERDEHGRPIIKCETCPFAQWRKKGAKNEPPPCSEKYTIPMLFSTDANGGQLDHAGILSFQRSGITPLKAYISGFVRTKNPLYSAYTQIKLERRSRGTVEYSVPIVSKVGTVPDEEWPDHSQAYKGIREILRMPPRFEPPTPQPTPQANTWPPVTQQAPVQQQAPIPAQVVNDPWASTQQPVQQPAWPSVPPQQPVQQAPVTQVPLMTGPGLIDAASQPIAPPVTTTAAQPVQPVQAVPQQVMSPVNDDDDLPF